MLNQDCPGCAQARNDLAYADQQRRELELQLSEEKERHQRIVEAAIKKDEALVVANRLNNEQRKLLAQIVETCLCVCGLESGKVCALAKAEEYLKQTEKRKDEGCEPCGNPSKACEEHGKPVGVSKASGPGFCGECLGVLPCQTHCPHDWMASAGRVCVKCGKFRG